MDMIPDSPPADAPPAAPPPAKWLFVSAAKGLQGYVLRSDPLKEMVGGSELIETLHRTDGRGFLSMVLNACAFVGNLTVLADVSGGARLLFDSEAEARQLARIWPLLASQYAPGLELSIALVKVENDLGKAVEQAERALNANRNLPSVALPEAGPVVARNRRTGLPASHLVDPLDQADKQDAVDLESKRKREAADRRAGGTLLEKIIPSAHKPEFFEGGPWNKWHPDLNKLGTETNPYLAVIHADANGLGSAMMRCVGELKEKPNGAKTYQDLCAAIDEASRLAAQAATELVLNKIAGQKGFVPLRPLVCAGEDFTCVIQAKYALKFAVEYLQKLECQTQKLFKPLQAEIPQLSPLTACAGIVFCKTHFPFSRAYAMAESLCGFAKQRTERKASALAFLRLKSSLSPSDNYEEFIDHSFMAGSQDDKVCLTMNPYHVGSSPTGELCTLSQLLALAKAMRRENLPFSGQRQLVSRAYTGKAAATRDYDRLCLVAKQRDEKKDAHAVEDLKTALNAMTGDGLWKQPPPMVAKGGSGQPRPSTTPFYDALELLHLGIDLA
jgi:hypothetical protein